MGIKRSFGKHRCHNLLRDIMNKGNPYIKNPVIKNNGVGGTRESISSPCCKPSLVR